MQAATHQDAQIDALSLRRCFQELDEELGVGSEGKPVEQRVSLGLPADGSATHGSFGEVMFL